MAKFKTIITTAGAAKIAAVLAGTASIVLDNTAKMAVGDGGGTLPTPNPAQTKLIKEVYRAPINRASIDASNPKNIIVELVIPPEKPDTSGFWVREMALYDAAGTLLAVGNMAETYKPSLSEGAGRKMVIRMVIAVSEVNAITITMDTTTVMATQDYVDSEIDKHAKSRNHPDATLTAKGFTQLNSATNSAIETQAATPKAVKTVMDATNLKAPLASPALTGTPTAPTAAPGTNSTQISTTAFVQAALAALVNSSPAVLDTLGELAGALGNDPNFATTMANALGLKAPLDSPALTGTPTAPTAAKTVNTTQLATTAFVKAVVADYATKASPALTGTPTAPTASAGNNTTQLATTAFVQAAVAALINASPAALDTLKELADALGNDPNFATTMATALGLKAPLDSPTLTGVPTGPTADKTVNTVQLATTAFVKAVVADYATKASPALSGIPTAPTAAAGTNTTQLSTTAFVQAAITALQTTINSALALKAPLASPALSGTPTAPTAAQTVNSTQIATTAYVKAAVAALINSSPAALDTLKELAGALGNDANFATTMANALAGKLSSNNNFSEIALAGAEAQAAARLNLGGLPTKSEAYLVGNNLSELATKGSAAQSAARLNMALGTAATRNVGTGANQIPDMGAFASNLGSAGSLNGSGSLRLPGGYLRQWGAAVANANGDVTVNFPVAFATKPDNVSFGYRQDSVPTSVQSIVINDPASDNTRLVCRAYKIDGTGTITGSTNAFYWVAEGKV
ncbi:phage tail-collar fiber domain-containing protein [Escherichia coli]